MAYQSQGRARGNAHQDTVRVARARPTAAPRGISTLSERFLAGTIGFPIFVGVVHLIVVQLAASLAFHFGTLTATSAPFNNVRGPETPLGGLANDVVGPLRLWDGLWYKLIAEEGYDYAEANAAFWPLFPWLMRLGHEITGMSVDVAGYLIANVSFVVALVLLYRLISLDFDQQIARRTLWAIALFPTALFFSAVYTESLFLMLVVGALLSARLGNWWLAGIIGALAALTRSYGVLLLVPFAILFVQQHGFTVRRWLPNAVPAALPALGPAIFGWWLDREGWKWRAFIDIQSEWNRTSATPWETMRCAVRGCQLELTQRGETRLWQVDGADWSWIGDFLRHPSWSLLTSETFRKRAADGDTIELVCTIGFLILAAIGLKALPLYQSAFLLPGLVIPLFQPSTVHPLMSMPRFGLTLFPLFVVIALLLNRRRIAWPAAALSTALLILFTIQFANWYWVS